MNTGSKETTKIEILNYQDIDLGNGGKVFEYREHETLLEQRNHGVEQLD